MRPSQANPTLVQPIALLMCVAMASVLIPGEVHAWGAHGHRIAARVAEARLTPEARAEIRGLLNQGDTLVDIANWADHEGHDVVPKSSPWHYVNVPITADQYDDRYCADGECVVGKIKHFRSVLSDRHASRRERQRALLFLVHFVADIHQPLHVGDNRDRGGNQTQVRFLNRGTNLHRLWDSDLINEIDRSEGAWVDRITPLITREAVADWSRGGVEGWATESLKAAKQAYYYPAGSRQPMASGAELGKDYVLFARPIIEQRLARAGIRLANELNAALRGTGAKRSRRAAE